ncbi:MAG: pilus assembly PilX family protein [Planctomycetota bacterium]|jgi:DNA uptake protein ComE-like DNA-binding protein
MKNNNFKKPVDQLNRDGIVLMITLVLLVIISILGYSLTTRMSAQRHRDRYMIDYQVARYACDSALKSAFSSLSSINPRPIARPNAPDFSDVFMLSEQEYQDVLDDWALQIAEEQAAKEEEDDDEADEDEEELSTARMLRDLMSFSGANDINAFDDPNQYSLTGDMNEPNSLKIPGPYGPEWPLVSEPVEFEIGSATVTIEIEDENAKYPLCLAMLTDENTKREVETSLETFCEWMSLDNEQIDSLKDELKEVSEIKPFKLDFKPVTTTIRAPSTRTTSGSRRRRSSRSTRTTKKTTPASVHTADVAQLLHSAIIDTDMLARPTVVSDTRTESTLKYTGIWGSKKVNINSAPRHVLEAVFAIGGDAEDIADEIIRLRREKPFKDFTDLKKDLFRFSDSLEKCEKYIITNSQFFTIRVAATSGIARASAVMAIRKDKKTVDKIAVIHD